MDRRAEREAAVAKLNELASEVGLDPVVKRAPQNEVSDHYKAPCKKISSDMVDELLEGSGNLFRAGRSVEA